MSSLLVIEQGRLTLKHYKDKRSGFPKLKQFIFWLRYNRGYKDGDLIPYEEVEESIHRIAGTDNRTVKKHLRLLVSYYYLEPKGHPIEKVSRVTVRTFSQVDSSPRIKPKQYHSPKGHSTYVFGLQAPKIYAETKIPRFLPPSRLPPTRIHESVSQSTSKLCVCDSGGEGGGDRGGGEVGDVGIGERGGGEDTVTHTYLVKPNNSHEKKTRKLGHQTSFTGGLRDPGG